MALLVGALFEWGRYYTAEGDWYEAVWLNLGFTRVAFASERYEFDDYFHQFYHGHFSLWYHLDKLLESRIGRAGFWLSLASAPAWELVEERVIRSAPVSLTDIAWAWLGVFLADAQAAGSEEGWGFRFFWVPLEGEFWEQSLKYMDLPAQSKLYQTLVATLPGNFNPYAFGLVKRSPGWELELGFSVNEPRAELRPEEPLLGWRGFVLDEKGLRLGTERLLWEPEALPRWCALPYLRVRARF